MPTINVDGEEIEVEAGVNLLEALLARGVDQGLAAAGEGQRRETAAAVDAKDAGRQALDPRRCGAVDLAASQRGHVARQPEQSVGRAAVPLRRRGNDQDVANVVAFLASDLAGFITGAFVPVCGGNVMPGI